MKARNQSSGLAGAVLAIPVIMLPVEVTDISCHMTVEIVFTFITVRNCDSYETCYLLDALTKKK